MRTNRYGFHFKKETAPDKIQGRSHIFAECEDYILS